jgi:hypothetical protein
MHLAAKARGVLDDDGVHTNALPVEQRREPIAALNRIGAADGGVAALGAKTSLTSTLS